MDWQEQMQFRRLSLSAGAIISALLCAFLIAPPALAAGSASGLSPAAGHTCAQYNSGQFAGVFCVEIAIYTTSKGVNYVTTQVEVTCPLTGYPADTAYPCYDAYVTAEIANGAGNITSAYKTCTGGCTYNASNDRTYLFPFGGLPAPTVINTCDNNVWGVAVSGAVNIGGGSNDAAFGSNNELKTPHYNVCLTAHGYTFS
jgi:hypothetical protein